MPGHWQIEQHLETLKPLVGMRAECLECHKVFTEHRALSQHLNFCRLEMDQVPVALRPLWRRQYRGATAQAASADAVN
jgi:hypothetical protein